ncbi:transglycosylase SLT domain-containing protein [Massilia sp. H6]|uniref:transglycosylase SLT domain-containing protein n=1 Tax=Massilia sp. H6 TaxID=2970464 RepID=UPI002169ADC0|nr:transglycosylase SLT domain-containing protein [Massilia sp. H6]UVW30261.1 transglycosylase SLT domain-containing protein [Massilia sp. H6]
MNDMIRTTLVTATLALLAAPTAYAMENAPASASAAAVSVPTSNLRSALAPIPALNKTDEYRETDVWGRIRSGYAIPDLDNNLVARHTRDYSAHPESLRRISGRASLYLYHVVQELEKRGMPTELALLPVIESAFNPQALSTASAAGLWQFVPGTGRDYDLKQNMFKDERRGVLASTDAALTYLQRLYTMFGDWQLALAAYNWGEGNVQRAIKKNQALGKGSDFESLADLMPAETRNYVPKLQAVKNIVANPAQYNIALPAIDNQPYFTAIDKTSDIDVAVAAQLAEMTLDEFRALNPQFKKPVITGGEKTKILLPKENAEKFHLNLAQWGRNLSTWTTHKITGARVSIASLASKFDTTPEVIRQANNIPAKSTLKAGSTILVPKVSASDAGNIAENIIDNAVVAFEAERSGGKRVKASSGTRYKAKAAARTSKSRIARNASSKRKQR